MLEKTFELARRVDDPFTIGLAHLHAGLLAYSCGDWGDAIDRCEEAGAIFIARCTGTMWETTFARRYGLSARMHRGELLEVSRVLPGLLAEADELGNVLAAANLRARFGIAWLAADDPQGCRQAAERALRDWSREGFHIVHFNGLIALCLADLYEGKGEQSHQRLDRGWPRGATSLVRRMQVARIEGLFLRGRCALAAAATTGDPRPLTAIAERAAGRLAREDAAYAQPMAQQIRATRAHLDGDRDAALLGLRRAQEGFQAVEMHLAAAANGWRWGKLTGGETGSQQVAAAEAWMRDQGILRPERMAATLAPGFEPLESPSSQSR